MSGGDPPAQKRSDQCDVFSNRPVRVKRFQTIHHCSVDVARELVPVWFRRDRLDMVLLLIRGHLRRSQAKFPFIALFRFAEPVPAQTIYTMSIKVSDT
jgi:hypothetical protein